VLLAANLEATLDFSDQELPDSILDDLLVRVAAQEKRLADLLDTWNEGHLLRDGATVVIAGRPNVGKSTLLNALLGRDRAIVSDQPGTTRDTIEECLVLQGIALHVVDTAGLREATCAIEREGIRRTEDHLARADLFLYVVDASHPVDKEEVARILTLDPMRSVIIANKQDLATFSSPALPGAYTVVPTSLTMGTGLDIMKSAMIQLLGAGNAPSVQYAAISERHRQLIDVSLTRVREARKQLEGHDQADTALAAQSLREAVAALGEVLGREYHEALLDSIFSRFCIGK
jgi:tRNA modification GTPase